ncbi:MULTISPECIES: ribonuclease R [unclassified Candidatus Paralachnospira]|uniref:ribonuclease R n=1 Tax=unclassified Candidatus Paralachnospira TaxID=3099471 RepID=UPI003F931F7C
MEEKKVLEEQKKRLLELFHHKDYVPMKVKELAILLGVPREERPALQAVLDALLSEGKIGISKRGKYALAENFLITGTFLGNKKGFGFVTRETEPGKEKQQDLFIPETETGTAMDGDTVQAALLYGHSYGRRKNPEGRVVRVLERAHKQIVATYEKCKNFGFAVPVNLKLGNDVFIPEEASMEADNGERVLVEILDYGNARKNPEGRVVEILGPANAPGVDILSVAKAYGFESEFPAQVMEEVRKIPTEVLPEEREGRMDFRDLQTVTIDGEDAKDLDDAITLSEKNGVYRLGVHIADVSHYVKEGTALDKEALSRGTSVYLVDRVIPMLPKELSNGICSLNAGADRLAFSCIMEIDQKGRVLGHEIGKSVIRVDRRMTYTAVNAVISGDETAEKEHEEFVPLFLRMKKLSDILREKRRKRGSIDFDFPESRILLDEKGRPVEIKAYERNAATMLIEDFMLLANETVAEDYYWQGQPFVYRTHENPDPDKIRELGLLISNFGYHLRTNQEEIHPGELQKLLAKIQDAPEEDLISRLTLRSMKRARYQTDCIGHFGLAAKYYCHFTSPIRRYPDLQIHRIMSDALSGHMDQRRQEHYEDCLPAVCVQCSNKERQADDAEREVEKMKKCQYMAHRIGEVYDGVISGVTGWGMYVELPNTVEGMIALAAMDSDYYEFDEKQYRLVGVGTGKIYKLGQKIRVRVMAVDRVGSTIDFMPEEDS